MGFRKTSVIRLWITILLCLATSHQRCITYGSNDDGEKIIYDDEPRALKPLNVELSELCGSSFGYNVETKDADFKVCCDEDQAADLVFNLAFLKGISAECKQPLFHLSCTLACHPNMSDFMSVAKHEMRDDSNVSLGEVALMNSKFVGLLKDRCDEALQSLPLSLVGVKSLTIDGIEELINYRAVTRMTVQATHNLDHIWMNNFESLDSHSEDFLNDASYDGSSKQDKDKNEPSSNPTTLKGSPDGQDDCSNPNNNFEVNMESLDQFSFMNSPYFLVFGLALTAVISTLVAHLHNIGYNQWIQQPNHAGKHVTRYWQTRESVSTFIEVSIQKFFKTLGGFAVTYPVSVIATCLVVCSVFSLGLIRFVAITDPVELWSVQDGLATHEKRYVEDRFGLDYRYSQLVLVPRNKTNVNNKTVLFSSSEYIIELMDIQEQIEKLNCKRSSGEPYGCIDKICLKPRAPGYNYCLIYSIAELFKKNRTLVPSSNEKLNRKLKGALESPFAHLALSGVPQIPSLVLAVGEGHSLPSVSEYLNSTRAFHMIFVNHNYRAGDEKLDEVMYWERSLVEHIHSLHSNLFEIYINSEASITDELDKLSKADFVTIASSYGTMLVYMAIFLATFRSWHTILLDSKILLGVACIIMILLSLTSSFGLFAFCGVHTTLIVLEVAPFLLLAIGCGDSFLFVKHFYNIRFNRKLTQEADCSRKDRIKNTVVQNCEEIGPSLMLSSCAQFVAFALGALIPVSAVRAFSLYSCLAVFLKFWLQMTFFVSVFYLDCIRQSNRRIDVLCCLKLKENTKQKEEEISYDMFFQRICRKCFTPVLMNAWVRLLIFTAFLIWFVVSLVFINCLEYGLEHDEIVSDNSDPANFLKAFSTYSDMGLPVYLIIADGYNYSNIGNIKGICSSDVCCKHSLMNTVRNASRNSNRTYIEAQHTHSWIDYYLLWFKNEDCCKVTRQDNSMFCDKDDPSKDCLPCWKSQFVDNKTLPAWEASNFVRHFISDSLVKCPLEIKAQLNGHLYFDRDIKEINNLVSTRYMMQTPVLRNSKDFISALKAHQHISTELSKKLEHNQGRIKPIFLYSMFHVYSQQYMDLLPLTLKTLILSIVCVFICILILVGMDIQSSLVVLVALLMTVSQMMAGMYWIDIKLNAVSVVNLVMSVGIAVEFYVHLTREFSKSKLNRAVDRMKDVIEHVGVVMFVGISIPEAISIFTMSFAKSKVFRTYFFRMYAMLIVICTVNSLIFLPAFLTYFGSQNRQQRNDDEIPKDALV